MSRFLKENLQKIDPYVPGEQPQGNNYIKLNTNEFAYPPSPKVIRALDKFNKEKLMLYPDPNVQQLKQALADFYQVDKEQIFIGNGSDEVLAFSFLAFFEQGGNR